MLGQDTPGCSSTLPALPTGPGLLELTIGLLTHHLPLGTFSARINHPQETCLYAWLILIAHGARPWASSPGKAKIFAAQVALSNANFGLCCSISPNPTPTELLHCRLVRLEEVLTRPFEGWLSVGGTGLGWFLRKPLLTLHSSLEEQCWAACSHTASRVATWRRTGPKQGSLS